jgi:hypothetical protein
MADTEEKVNKAKKLIHNVIETVSLKRRILKCLLANSCQAASIPEGQNELKRNQLRELAALNGTLRDDENQACQNCKCSCPLCFGISAKSLKVDKSDIGNMIVQNNVISRLTSSVAFAATQGIWLETVQIDSVGLNGATVPKVLCRVALLLDVLVAVTLLIVNTR